MGDAMTLPPIAVPMVAVLAALGFGNAPWWIALLGGALIGAAGVLAQRDLRPRSAAVTFVDMLPVAGVSSLAYGLIAAFAAMATGRLLQCAWTLLMAAGSYPDSGIDFF